MGVPELNEGIDVNRIDEIRERLGSDYHGWHTGDIKALLAGVDRLTADNERLIAALAKRNEPPTDIKLAGLLERAQRNNRSRAWRQVGFLVRVIQARDESLAAAEARAVVAEAQLAAEQAEHQNTRDALDFEKAMSRRAEQAIRDVLLQCSDQMQMGSSYSSFARRIYKPLAAALAGEEET